MKKILIALCLSAFLSININAQSTAKEWYDLGLNQNDSSNYDLAIKSFEKAIALDSKYSEAYFQLGWIYNEQEKFDIAIEQLKKAVAIKPDYAFALQEIGYALNKKKDYTQALTYLNKAIAAKPDYAMAYKIKGDVNINLKKDAEAIGNFKKAYELDNTNSGACYSLGYYYNGVEDYKNAEDWLNKAVDANPTENNYNELGFAKYKLKKNEEAIAAYNKALEINPESATAYIGIGNVYRMNYEPAKTSEAIESYKQALNYEPDDASTNYAIGWCFNDAGNNDSAIVYLKKTVAIDKEFTQAFVELGYAQYIKGQYTDALATLNKALALSPKESLPFYYKGFVYIEQKDKKQAMEMYNQLKPLNTSLAAKLLDKINAMK